MSNNAGSLFNPIRTAKPAVHLFAWGIAALTILYIASFPVLKEPIFVIIPVALAGWVYGVRGGWIASGLAFILDLFLVWLLQERNVSQFLVQRELETFFLSQHFIILMAGISLGQLQEMSNNRLMAEAELRSRDRYHTLLKITISDILNPKNSNNKYYYLITHMANLFVADYGFFLRWDTDHEQVILIESLLPIEQRSSNVLLDLHKSEIIRSGLQTDDVLIFNDVLNSQDAINSTLFKNLALPIHSTLTVPLVTQEYKLGVVLLGCNASRHFTPVEIDNAKQAGAQIALAIWNVQQDIELKKRLQEVETLARISQALSETERIGLQTVLQLIVTSAMELIPKAEQAVIHLLNKETQLLEAQAVGGYDKSTTNWKLVKIRPNEGVAGQVLVSGETINLADVEKDVRYITYTEPPKYHSLVVAPVQSGEQKLGTISVQSVLVNAFTEAESRLLSALGTLAAIAIENTDLLENVQQSLKESNALYLINQKLVASLDPQELLKDVVNMLQKNFGYHHVQIYVMEPKTGDFIMQQGSGEIGRKLKEHGHRLHAGEGIVGYTAETRQAFFTNNVDEMFSFVRTPFLPDTKSELAVPVIIDNQILGLLDIQQVPPAHLSQHDLQLVSAVADQLAIALQKAHLHEELQASLAQEKSTRNQLMQNERLVVMGRLLATVSHELNNPLQAIQNALFLLKEEKGISEQGKQDLGIVLAESEHMASMIERLRDTYRPIRAQDYQPTQINSIIEDVNALISTHLRHNQIDFEFHPNSNLPEIPALADQFRQVILNLFMNAVEAMPNGGELTVSTEMLDESDEILITIADTGSGIDPSILPNIFDAFVTNKKSGTGLGLTITYDIVMKHQGRIQAINNEGRGTTFHIWLPVHPKEII